MRDFGSEEAASAAGGAPAAAGRPDRVLAELTGAEAAEALGPDARGVARLASGDPLSKAAVADVVRLFDAIALTLALLFAGQALGDLAPASAAFAAAASALVAAGLLRLYGTRRIEAFWRSWAATGTLGALTFGAARLLGGGALAEAALALPFSLAALLPHRAVAAAGVRWARGAGAFERRAVLVGGGDAGERTLRGLLERRDPDIRVIGVFDDRDDERSPPLIDACRKLGRVAELAPFARLVHVDLAIVTLPLSAEARIRDILRTLSVLPIDVRLAETSADLDFPEHGREGGLGMLMRRPLGARGRRAKRALDLVGASLALLALAPVMIGVAVAIRLDSPGPIFFRQRRHGYNHRAVEVLKFRSMRHEEADPEARRIVTRSDPRVTRVGRFLRRSSIDELPQLFTVLRGEMSLVGPRPHALVARSSEGRAFAEIVEGYSARHRAKPGITGWAQIHGWRGEVDDPEALRRRFEHDMWYIENWSVGLDLKILARTPLSLLDVRRAY